MKLEDKAEDLSLELRGYCNAAYLIVEAAQEQVDGFATLGCIRDPAKGKLMEYIDSLFFLLTAINRTVDKAESAVISGVAETN